ncbi:type II CAAX endopeptidase family protein [Arthrobacter sp. ZGTC131]|uniref:type II CAAX endopeptidase family protein n=1 Tax=Arthrobacter sp. ZGTC131 TaxID=2058898 RepID=UPI0011B054F6|nr:type II CAAX endopeptidase family protein [Arthrobacter sp. ZGTC131]
MNPGGSPATSRSAAASRIRQHPVAAFLVVAITLSWAAQVLSILLLGNILPGILAELLILLGTAVLVTGAADGRPAVRDLVRRAFRWRVAPGWYVAALLALPALTLLIAAATGTFHSPADGWAPLLVTYLLNTVVIGALLGNIWEELAWTGVVQHRLMDRHGAFVAAVLTAIPFALIHVPFAFAERGFANTPLADAAAYWAVLFLFAPFFRALMGLTYLRTGYSLLIVGLLHASFNASAATKLDAFDGDWQQIAAAIVLLGVVAALRIFRSPRPTGKPLPDQRERTLQHPTEAADQRKRTLQHPTEAAEKGTAKESGHGSSSAG